MLWRGREGQIRLLWHSSLPFKKYLSMLRILDVMSLRLTLIVHVQETGFIQFYGFMRQFFE